MDHRKHRNVLYSIVIILAVINITSFTILSVQISNLNTKFQSQIDSTKTDLQDYSADLVKTYDSVYQQNFNEISTAISQQQKDFQQELTLIKSSQNDFSGIVDKAVKSVVTVSTGNSVGSGFIISKDGYIVTNNHVIEGEENNLKVLTYDRDIISAELIGADETRDLALLKIDGSYDSLNLADSSSIQVGKKVIAIGNPLGLSFTVTEGIISGLDRTGPNGREEYLQTDVSLNPGNSGGPLIDTSGKVVGINNFKIGGAESLGFALESKYIRESINSIAGESLL